MQDKVLMIDEIPGGIKVLPGDCIKTIATLEPQSVNCVVTSPPYFGLRNYGIAPTQWPVIEYVPMTGLSSVAVEAMECCLGDEKTPSDFVAHLVHVFRQVWDALRDDGTLWLNLGDSYAASQSNNGGYSEKSTLAGFTNPNTKGRQANEQTRSHKTDHGLKSKNLIGIPWRVALALQADGWILRQDIIWAKPNPMPESVTDRCTKSHEYLFMFSKSQKYFYDADAIKEPITDSTGIRLLQNIEKQNVSERVPGKTNGTMKAVGGKKFTPDMAGGGTSYVGHSGYKKSDGSTLLSLTRNKRSVWTITTQPYSEAHFAVFPPKLIKPAILAGCPIGGTVLDIFGGSGTTAQVARSLGRKAILCEANEEYIEIMKRRLNADQEVMLL
jgi:DNA modification methylase